MDEGLLLIVALTFTIHLIGTLAYSVRIAGSRTGRVALSLSVFNLLVLVSRTSNAFQAPLLAKRVEGHIAQGALAASTADFRWLILSATLATAVGAFLIPTFQRLFAAYVDAFGRQRSFWRLLSRMGSPAARAHFTASLALPRWRNISTAHQGRHVPWGVVLLNTLAIAAWTVGVFAALYAGHLRPELRVTASQLSSVVNGVATILLFGFIDPYLSLLTDEVAGGTLDDAGFRRSIVWLTASRLAGTVLAQGLLVPAAAWIAFVAEKI
jgi:hypothetical protein